MLVLSVEAQVSPFAFALRLNIKNKFMTRENIQTPVMGICEEEYFLQCVQLAERACVQLVSAPHRFDLNRGRVKVTG